MGFEDLIDPVNRAVGDTLGIPGVWTPKGSGLPVSVRAVFRREHRVFDPETGANVATTQSSAWIRTADLPREALENDRFAIAGLEFLIAAIEPDGQGGVVLVLELEPE